MRLTYRQIFECLELLNVVKAEIAYVTEGNKRNCRDFDILFYKPNGQVLLLDFIQGDPFHKGLLQPMLDKHGYYGDNPVDGVITWDVRTKIITDQGQEEVRKWEDYEHNIVVNEDFKQS